MPRYDYLIVGGGMTADAAARGIRELDSSGTIGLISAEPDAPYSRPPLSKALWRGEPEGSIWRGTESTGATMHLGRRATSVDPSTRRVGDDQGEQYEYQSLLLATGGSPRTLPFPAPGVIYYRTVRDYHALRELADHRQRFLVIGGGFIGSEVAAALRMANRDVVMIMPEAGISARVFPAELSHNVLEYYRAKGVDVRPGRHVSSIERRGECFTVGTDVGESISVDGVVAGLGVMPDVALTEAFGLPGPDGIDVDERLRTRAPGVFAAGDVARFHNHALGTALRVEHEDNALAMGTAAGRSMAGDETPYDHLPFFYSDLFDLGYEAVGLLDSRLATFADWTEPYREGVVYYLSDRRVRGVLLWNVWGQVDAARALIAEPGPHGPETLVGRIAGQG
jgi:NADPH-dependent 2,4-dienoyl-CoA reductase/sulfur reductase-like enzyme